MLRSIEEEWEEFAGRMDMDPKDTTLRKAYIGGMGKGYLIRKALSEMDEREAEEEEGVFLWQLRIHIAELDAG